MHPRTTATLERLEDANWFSCVGIKDTTVAIVLSSWQEAIQHCSSMGWQNLLLEADNQYVLRVLERSKERYRMWNDVVAEMKQTTIPLVRRKIEAVVREHRLPQVFEDTVQWDILGVCMEAEYADVFPPASMPARRIGM
jgi:hypothetical protein